MEQDQPSPETSSPGVPVFQSVIPPHAQVRDLRLDFESRSLHVVLDGAEEEAVPAQRVRRLHAARIRFTEASRSTYDVLGSEHSQGDHDVHSPILALEVEGDPRIWIVHLESFNYRHALGAAAGFTIEQNLPLLLDALAGFCPGAARDEGFDAMMGHQPPPTVESLRDFLAELRK